VSAAEPPSERQRDVGRIEAFSDGVFAFAATLLALGIRIPTPSDADASSGLSHLLIAQWPSYFAFVLSFLSVGIIWANHHVLFGYFVRADRGVVFLNLVNLMLIAFIPVSTAVLGAWLASGPDRLTAVLLYGGLLLVYGIVHNLLWWYGAYWSRVTSPELTARQRRTLTYTWLGGPTMYAVALMLAAIDPRLSIAAFALIHLAYLLPTARLVAVTQGARRGRRRSRS
jgi:TMEM175 potassium channel family protein